MRAGDLDAGVTLAKHRCRSVGRAGIASQEEQASPRFGRAFAERRDEIAPGHAFGQGRALQLARPHQRHAVGDDEVEVCNQRAKRDALVRTEQVVEVRRDDRPAATGGKLGQDRPDDLPLRHRMDGDAGQAGPREVREVQRLVACVIEVVALRGRLRHVVFSGDGTGLRRRGDRVDRMATSGQGSRGGRR